MQGTILEFRRVLRAGGHVLIVTAAEEGSEPGYADVPPFPPGSTFKPHLYKREEVVSWMEGFELLELLHLQVEVP